VSPLPKKSLKAASRPAARPAVERSTFARLGSRTRLAVSLACGVAAGFVASLWGPWQLIVLVGWDAAALSYLGVAWSAMVTLDAQSTRRYATREDDSRAVVDLILVLASVASLVGVIASLAHDRGNISAPTIVALVTVVVSWLTVHSSYTLRYAHLFYSDPVGGVSFGDQDSPDYTDFAYLAFTVGMTFQVSDTEVSDRTIRRAITRHALLSYLFGTVIVGVTINVVGSLIS
jgi:uncharacterized membrane protein